MMIKAKGCKPIMIFLLAAIFLKTEKALAKKGNFHLMLMIQKVMTPDNKDKFEDDLVMILEILILI